MKNILVLTDFSEKSKHAAEVAWTIAKQVRADLLLYNVCYIPDSKAVLAGPNRLYYDNYTIYNDATRINLQVMADRLVQRLFVAGEEFNPSVRCTHDIGLLKDNIKAIQEREDIWMIVMGDKSDEGIIHQLVYSSDSNEVVNKAKCPVLLVPEKFTFRSLKKIAFTTDVFSNVDFRALIFVAELARPFRAEISVTHINLNELGENSDSIHYKSVKRAKDDINYERISYKEILADEVPKTLVQYAYNIHADIITLVHKRYPFFEDLFHISTTKRMMNYHLLPMLIFPAAF
ncbi:universal stress protein [Desertivirga arenae]|uniref:universal stress protein n=1 Tax=Desertivirga arenae TaxID=2810309 RepID=UPI001A96BAB8|nr:universal stress protein [Pedobacter sp. SYSU D00823]